MLITLRKSFQELRGDGTRDFGSLVGRGRGGTPSGYLSQRDEHSKAYNNLGPVSEKAREVGCVRVQRASAAADQCGGRTRCQALGKGKQEQNDGAGVKNESALSQERSIKLHCRPLEFDPHVIGNPRVFPKGGQHENVIPLPALL